MDLSVLPDSICQMALPARPAAADTSRLPAMTPPFCKGKGLFDPHGLLHIQQAFGQDKLLRGAVQGMDSQSSFVALRIAGAVTTIKSILQASALSVPGRKVWLEPSSPVSTLVP
jgi:hypothetical protein